MVVIAFPSIGLYRQRQQPPRRRALRTPRPDAMPPSGAPVVGAERSRDLFHDAYREDARWMDRAIAETRAGTAASTQEV